MGAAGKAAVWNHSFNTAMEFLRCGDLDALEVYDIIRMMWISSLVCDSDVKFMLKALLDYHCDLDLVAHPKIGAFLEILGGV